MYSTYAIPGLTDAAPSDLESGCVNSSRSCPFDTDVIKHFGGARQLSRDDNTIQSRFVMVVETVSHPKRWRRKGKSTTSLLMSLLLSPFPFHHCLPVIRVASLPSLQTVFHANIDDACGVE